MSSLGIAIDGGRFVRIDPKHAQTPKNIRLRTLNGGQSTARLDFYAFRGRRRLLKRTVRVEGLSGTDGSPAELRLRAERISGTSWEVRIRRPDGRSETIRVRTGRGGMGILVAIIASLSVLAVFFLLSNRSCFRTSGAPARESAAFRIAGGGGRRAEVSDPAGRDGAAAEIGDVEDGRLHDGEVADSGGAAERPSLVERMREQKAESGEVSDGSDRLENERASAAAPGRESAGEGETGPSSADAAAVGAAAALAVLPAPVVVYFFPESAELTGRGRSILDAFARDLPDDAVVVIGGHCANYGTESGRRSLSEARANAAATYLRGRVGPSVRIEARGYGVSTPATDDPLRQDLNRRVEISARRDG